MSSTILKKQHNIVLIFFSIFSWIFAFYFLVGYQIVLLLHAHKSYSSETISLTYAKTGGVESCSCIIYKNRELLWHKIYSLIPLSVFCNSLGVSVFMWKCWSENTVLLLLMLCSSFSVRTRTWGASFQLCWKKDFPLDCAEISFVPKLNIWREIHTKKGWKLLPSGENFKFLTCKCKLFFFSCTVGIVIFFFADSFMDSFIDRTAQEK